MRGLIGFGVDQTTRSSVSRCTRGLRECKIILLGLLGGWEGTGWPGEGRRATDLDVHELR